MGVERAEAARLSLAVAACFALRAVVGAPSLVVFGDSLSDDGSGSHEIVRSFFARKDADSPPQQPPTPPYWYGRWSNGPVWSEVASLALKMRLVNMAVGGSSTGAGGPRYWKGQYSSSSGKADNYSITIPSLKDQVDYFRPNPDSGNDVVVIFVGGNDYFGPAESEPPAVIDAIYSATRVLMSKGMRRFVYFTYILPFSDDLGFLDPKFEDNNERLKTFVRTNFSGPQPPGFRVQLWDAAGEYKDILDNAGSLGFSNGITPCLSHTSDNGYFDCSWFDAMEKSYDHTCKDGSGASWKICGNPDQHLIWDGSHPTAAVHKLLGNRFAKFLQSKWDNLS